MHDLYPKIWSSSLWQRPFPYGLPTSLPPPPHFFIVKKVSSEQDPESAAILSLYCPKSNQNFRDITQNVEENEILHEIFRLVSRFPRYISCFISESRLPLGQCIAQTNKRISEKFVIISRVSYNLPSWKITEVKLHVSRLTLGLGGHSEVDVKAVVSNTVKNSRIG